MNPEAGVISGIPTYHDSSLDLLGPLIKSMNSEAQVIGNISAYHDFNLDLLGLLIKGVNFEAGVVVHIPAFHVGAAIPSDKPLCIITV